MKYRAITAGVVPARDRQLQYFSNFKEDVIDWAEKVSKQYKTNVKIFEISEQILTVIEKPYEKPKKSADCTCGERVYCSVHPGIGWQKGRKA